MRCNGSFADPKRVLILALIAAAICGCPPAQQPKPRADDVRVVPGEIDAKRLLAAPAERARDAGAGPLIAVGARVVTDGEQLGSFIEVPTTHCALILARAGKSVSDVDLFVYTDGGDRLVSDEAPDPRAAVMLCPPHPRRVYVVARSVSGEGVIALGVMRVTQDKADAVSKAVDARGRPGQDTGKLEQWPGLERAIRERRASLGSKWQDLRRVAVPLSPHAYTAVTAEIEEQRCLDVLVVPSDEVQGVDAIVVDDAGRTIARGQPPGKSRAFVLCTEMPQVVTVLLRPRVSSGLAAVIIARSERGAATELIASTFVAGAVPLVPLDRAVARHAERMAKLRLSEVVKAGDGNALVGASTSMSLDLQAGCARIDVVGGQPLGRYSAELWDAGGVRLGRMRGGEHAATFVCGPGTKARIEVMATDRAGPFEVQVRHDSQPPEVLTKHGLAGSRLLSRLEAAVGPVDSQHAAGARVVPVAHDSRASERIALGAGKCAEIVVSVGPGASDVSLSVGFAGEPATRSMGSVATLQRICAGPKAQTAIAHVVVGQGEADALLLAHMSP